MNKFLEQTKTTLQSIVNYEKVHVVLGNESCDLDSAISSIVYGYFIFKTQVSSNTNTCVIPVLNISQDEFPLRTETKYFLLKNGINIDNLTFRNQIDLTALSSNDRLKLTLVDHLVLPVQDKPLAKSVVEVIDHRPVDFSDSWKDISVIIDTVGSCATLVTNIIVNKQCDNVLDDTIVKLLHGTIVLDTINFNTTANRFKPLDKEMVAALEKRVKIQYTRDTICSELISARSDVSTLTPIQILHRDMKVINGMPFPGVPMLVADFLDLSGAKESLSEFCQSKKCKVIVPMGLITRGGRVYRDLGVFAIADCGLKSAIIECLKAKEDLQLSEVDTTVPGLKLFSQEYPEHYRDIKAVLGAFNKKLTRCKYGFRFAVNNTLRPAKTGIRYMYVRREDEDGCVIPYNLPLILMWDGHVNAQLVTPGGWELYLAKYVGKADAAIKMHITTKRSNECAAFMKGRVISLLEATTLLEQRSHVMCTREIVYLPVSAEATHRILKRQQHMAELNDGDTNLYYDTKLEKYLDRPQQLSTLTYEQYYEQYIS